MNTPQEPYEILSALGAGGMGKAQARILVFHRVPTCYGEWKWQSNLPQP